MFHPNNIKNPMIMIPEIGEIPFFERRNIPAEEWGDGLLVRTPNWLGDAVMSIPAICVLKKMLPETCGLFILCPKGIVPVFESLQGVADRVIGLADAHAFLNATERQQVRRLQCGAGILFNNSFRDALSLRICGVRRLFGSAARYRSLLLERSFSFPPRLDHTWNKPHQAAKYLSMAYALGAPEWDGSLPEFHEQYAPETASDELRGVLNQDHVLCAAAGAAYGDAKRWNTDSFAEVCLKWTEQKNGSVVLLGSGKERSAADEILQKLPSGKAVNLAGRTNLHEVIRLLKHAEICIANDSGLMHLAAVLGTPGVVPFGPTDPAATSPLSEDWHIICKKIECSPCFKRTCPLGTKACFDEITPEVVFSEIMKLSSKTKGKERNNKR